MTMDEEARLTEEQIEALAMSGAAWPAHVACVEQIITEHVNAALAPIRALIEEYQWRPEHTGPFTCQYLVDDLRSALDSRIRSAAPTTHCANCGDEVPVDQPHKFDECRFRPAAPSEDPR